MRKLNNFFRKVFFFKHSSEISLGLVRDKVRFVENGDSIVLHVCSDPNRLMSGLSKAKALLQMVDDKTPEEDAEKIANLLATVMFGEKQAQQLNDFYFGEPRFVINVCCKYFAKKLSAKIVKVQKNATIE